MSPNTPIYPPGSNSLVIPSNLPDFFLKSTESLAKCPKQTGPALDFLQKHGHLTPTSSASQEHQPRADADVDAAARPLILHVFSNGGVLSLLATLLGIQLTNRQLARPVTALILDSAPIPRTSEAVHESAYLMTMALPRMLQVVFRPVVYAVLCAVDLVLYRWIGVKPRLDVNCDALLADADLARVPKLVLYSLGDEMVRPWHVEKFLGMLTSSMDTSERVEEKTYSISGQPATTSGDGVEPARVDRSLSHGGLVSVVRFPKDSRHVQHLRKYTEEYRSAVAKFIGLARL
ncbi:hypothetical protein BCR44DRAFT_1425236 [Catenaria anguillulae PL171]|uniref:Uncharacterized protein n=1 Tax=Catenaria anguillulae PL171 TaxID=765915 RepID=A0A1Y2I0X7_9FUNG|nr:hypothetical protein BCR44DRAFT_1425236 [Catenaria anguillulae PL171]